MQDFPPSREQETFGRLSIETNNQTNLELELFYFLASQKFETPRKICEKRIENICSNLKREIKQKAIKEALLAKWSCL